MALGRAEDQNRLVSKIRDWRSESSCTFRRSMATRSLSCVDIQHGILGKTRSGNERNVAILMGLKVSRAILIHVGRITLSTRGTV